MNATATYQDVAPVIRAVARAHHRQHGGEQDELESEGNLIFLQVLNNWTSRHRRQSDLPFAAWVRLKVRYGLHETARRLACKSARLGSRIPLETLSEPIQFPLWEATEGLPQDAAYCAKLAVDPPLDVRRTARLERGDDARSMRRAIAERLRDEGWTDARIFKAFAELGRALL